MTGPILVTGGTGTLGRCMVPRLTQAGHAVRVLTRRGRPDEDGVQYVTGDLATGAGIDAAMDGVSTIVHCAGNGRGDEETTRTLVQAALPTAPHLVFISVVGADRVPMAGAVDRTLFGYFGTKRAAERVVAESGLPWTTLRASQFYDLALTVARALTKLPVVPAFTGQRFQPVETDEVAARLVELALGEPSGLVPDLAGPHIYSMTELIRGYLRATHRRRLIMPVPVPGKAARAIRDGAILNPDQATGKRTWEEFLADHVAAGNR